MIGKLFQTEIITLFIRFPSAIEKRYQITTYVESAFRRRQTTSLKQFNIRSNE